jgi:hypothetical protein
MTEQEKMSILVRDFRKLDEIRKDYIGDLTRKLADIHCGKFNVSGTELGDKVLQKSDMPVSNIHCNQGVLV